MMMTKMVPCFACGRPVTVTGPDLTDLDGDLCSECLDLSRCTCLGCCPDAWLPDPTPAPWLPDPEPAELDDFDCHLCQDQGPRGCACNPLDARTVHPYGYGLRWEVSRMWSRLTHAFG